MHMPDGSPRFKHSCRSANNLVPLGYAYLTTCILFFQCLTQPKKWPIGDLIALDSYASGRIFVGGDAVCPFTSYKIV